MGEFIGHIEGFSYEVTWRLTTSHRIDWSTKVRKGAGDLRGTPGGWFSVGGARRSDRNDGGRLLDSG